MQNKNLIAEGDGCKIMQFRNESGDGTMTFYDVFPGIGLIYNDFHMNAYASDYHPDVKLFCIDHCREGRMEYSATEGAYSYVEAGDLKFDRRLSHTGIFEMPLSHYHGITIAIEVDQAEKFLKKEGKDFPVNLYKLQEKFCRDEHPTVLHDTCSLDQIFGQLYHVPQKIKIPYFKIKILELLLYLYAMELPDTPKEKPYFYRTQVEKTKAIKRYLTEHLQEHVTQEELANRFEVSMTGMKQCFKSIYGMPIASWMQQYRMNYAAEILLANRKISIAELAGKVGYDSPSKFAMAFRKVMGMSPTEYRGRKN